MSINQLKEVKEIKQESSKKKKFRQKENKLMKFILSFFNGTILAREKVVNTLPFLLFLAFLAVVYITNSYYSERTIRKIEKMKSELKELRTEHISVKSDLMFKSKQSEIAGKLLLYGIKESVIPPIKIFIQKDSIGAVKNQK